MDEPTPQSDIPAFATLAADPEIAPRLEFEPATRKIKRPDGWAPELQRELVARIAATVLCGLLVAAWATVMTSHESMGVVGVLLSTLLTFFSYIFWRLDQRNSYLTKEAEKVIGTAENRLFGEDSKLFSAEQMDRPLGKARHLTTKSWSFGTSLGVIFLVVGLIGLAGAIFSGISAAGRKSGADSKVVSKANSDEAISRAPPRKTKPVG